MNDTSYMCGARGLVWSVERSEELDPPQRDPVILIASFSKSLGEETRITHVLTQFQLPALLLPDVFRMVILVPKNKIEVPAVDCRSKCFIEHFCRLEWG